MKDVLMVILAVAVVFLMTACGTVGGAVSGAGSDLQKAGDWIKSK
ncbi:hypothetical protein UFOVP257_216 [uncultured Caudovirales phage]|uniref:Uncharacterized protein n=1 Tax=uncultured Caudovirales phage TaxID=2100421 RepID=A0A6J5LH31_9CAUD|nr:hypothetical protein UFOVP257_216 [uncultured Caudovirales phage]